MKGELLDFIWSVFGPHIWKITIGVAVVLAIGLLIEVIKAKIRK